MDTLVIYTDGSHLNKQNKQDSRLGCGGVLVDPDGGNRFGQIKNKFSRELIPEFMKLHYGTDDCSNPTAEMMGVLLALSYFRKDIISANLKKLIICADYEGVKYWLTDVWSAKKPYIRKIKDEITTELEKLGLLGKVEFRWVKGHQNNIYSSADAYWNNYVDKLAKGL